MANGLILPNFYLSNLIMRKIKPNKSLFIKKILIKPSNIIKALLLGFFLANPVFGIPNRTSLLIKDSPKEILIIRSGCQLESSCYLITTKIQQKDMKQFEECF